MNLAAVICVRMSSNRLPGKALCVYDEDTGKSNLECLVDRVRTSRHNPDIIVATSTDEGDNAIEKSFDKFTNEKTFLFRGDLQNVVRRFDGAVKCFTPDATHIFRVMADCPLVDISLVDWRLDVLERNSLDFLTMVQPEPTYAAQGSVWSREAWDYCAKMSSGSQNEHPGAFLYEQTHQFKTVMDIGPENIYYQPIRTELDTPEDLEFFKAIWEGWNRLTISPSENSPNTQWVLRYLSRHPEIVKLNSHIVEKTHTTQLHGHHRARRVKCENPNCDCIVGYKVNNAFEMDCPRCGTKRKIYV